MKLIAIRLTILVIFLGFWELVSGRIIDAFFISSPTKIAVVFWSWVIDGSLFYHAAITATEAFVGFALGAVFGIVLGILLGRATRVAEVLNPFIVGFYSIPKVALAPLFIMWFGIGIEMKIVLTGTIVFFLVFLNTYTGVRSVSPELTVILRLMGANESELLRKVIVPSAITWVFAGLRLSVPYAIIGAIVGEIIASNRGLGFLLTSSSSQFDTAGVFAALVAIIALSAILNLLVSYVAALAMPWQKNTKQQEVAI